MNRGRGLALADARMDQAPSGDGVRRWRRARRVALGIDAGIAVGLLAWWWLRGDANSGVPRPLLVAAVLLILLVANIQVVALNHVALRHIGEPRSRLGQVARSAWIAQRLIVLAAAVAVVAAFPITNAILLARLPSAVAGAPALLSMLAMVASAFVAVNAGSLALQYADRQRIYREIVDGERAALRARCTLEEVFLTSKDGRLIAHASRVLRPGADAEIRSSMLSAIQGFVKGVLDEEGTTGSLGEVRLGGFRLLIEDSAHCVLSCAVRGGDPWDLRDRMRCALATVEDRNAPALAAWTGERSVLAGIEEAILGLVPSREEIGVVEDVFLIGHDGELVLHVSQRTGPDVPVIEIERMFQHAARAVRRSQRDRSPDGRELPVEGGAVLLEHGPSASLAVLLTGPEPGYLRASMVAVLEEVIAERAAGSTDGESGVSEPPAVGELLERLLLNLPIGGAPEDWELFFERTAAGASVAATPMGDEIRDDVPVHTCFMCGRVVPVVAAACPGCGTKLL